MSQTSGAAGWQQQRQVFQQLNQALQSGDLKSAQSAFSSLTANSSNTLDPNSPLGKLGQALASGDLSGAQQDFASMRAGGRHHHHDAAATTAAPPASAPSAAPASSSDTTGTVVDAVA
jgi:hypothetical protein